MRCLYSRASGRITAVVVWRAITRTGLRLDISGSQVLNLISVKFLPDALHGADVLIAFTDFFENTVLLSVAFLQERHLFQSLTKYRYDTYHFPGGKHAGYCDDTRSEPSQFAVGGAPGLSEPEIEV